MKRIFIGVFIAIIFSISCNEHLYASPKREIRAVWIATLINIDWPSQKGMSTAAQKAEFIRKLDYIQAMGFNTIIVQVRPAADAFYASSYEPWSQYLTGTQGQAPYPFYDPLAFMVEEAHKRNLEIHAWFNPYRALVKSSVNPNPSNHPTRLHPDWIIHYDGKSFFDPGNPAARAYILKVMLEVVEKYDIDAVHIDDYFYPYPSKGKVFNDQASYLLHGKGQSLEDWRRENVNTFIEQLNRKIKQVKPYVKFGVSPFGIWRNEHVDPSGSSTNGTSCYDDLYSDVRLWMRKSWVDYMAPQLYWERGHSVADFSSLLHWWVKNSYKRDLVIGLGVYKMVGAKKGAWTGSNEILSQIADARSHQVAGFALYSLSSFEKIGPELSNKLQEKQYFGNIAIPPTMPWIDSIAPIAPSIQTQPSKGKQIQWTKQSDQYRFLVYRFAKGEKINLHNSGKIVALTHLNTYQENEALSGTYTYVVTALDRLWNESEASNVIELSY